MALLLPPALLSQSAIKITSPADRPVVRPGQTIDVQVETSGPAWLVAVTDPSPVMTIARHSLRFPPYRFSVTVPANGAPGLHMITAEFYDDRHVIARALDTVWVDVERPDSPRELRVSAGLKEIQVGHGVDLAVRGIFAGGEDVYLNQSTRTTYEAYPPDAVSVSKEGQVIAKKPGTATIIVRHQNLSAAVDISVSNADLQITSPPAGTLVHPGETLTVEVNASGGPYEGGISAGSLDIGVGTLSTPPYRYFLQVPLPKKPGLTNVFAIGRVGALAIFSPSVPVDIERSDAPEAIFTDRQVIGTERLEVGQQGQIYVYGKFRDNPQVNLTDSSLLTYETDKEGIISVGKSGYTKGLSVGSTKVTVRYGELRTTVTVVVEE